jgi:hypothetical protein
LFLYCGNVNVLSLTDLVDESGRDAKALILLIEFNDLFPRFLLYAHSVAVYDDDDDDFIDPSLVYKYNGFTTMSIKREEHN